MGGPIERHTPVNLLIATDIFYLKNHVAVARLHSYRMHRKACETQLQHIR